MTDDIDDHRMDEILLATRAKLGRLLELFNFAIGTLDAHEGGIPGATVGTIAQVLKEADEAWVKEYALIRPHLEAEVASEAEYQEIRHALTMMRRGEQPRITRKMREELDRMVRLLNQGEN